MKDAFLLYMTINCRDNSYKIYAREKLYNQGSEQFFFFIYILTQIFMQKHSKPINVMQKDLERYSFMSATQVQNYDIIYCSRSKVQKGK